MVSAFLCLSEHGNMSSIVVTLHYRDIFVPLINTATVTLAALKSVFLTQFKNKTKQNEQTKTKKKKAELLLNKFNSG